MSSSRIKIFAGNSNPALVRAVSEAMDLPVGEALVSEFSDGEVRVEIHENVRGEDAFVIQSTCRPVNRSLMELLLMIDALKRASAANITAVLPYYGYGRQDQKDKPRVSITAKLVADLISEAGADRVISIDLHANQIQGFFKIPVDNLSGVKVLFADLRNHLCGDEVVVAPDAGGVTRAREFARRVNADLAIMDYRGMSYDAPASIVGDVRDRSVILLDDMVDTGKTLVRTAAAAKAAGARTVDAFCVHAILSQGAIDRINTSEIRWLVVTDTIPLSPEAAQCEKIRVASVSMMLAECIERVHYRKSVSSLVA
ncbi:MAG: ribose-phosphate diphosphokinase [Syntrophobacteraceae bacterium]